METSTKNLITVETVINAPVEKVWKHWTEPNSITKWCQASDDWHAPYADNDLRTEGKFKTTMAAKDGSMSFDFEGVYTKVEHLKHIGYTMGDGRTVAIDFERLGDKTKVVETFEAESTHPVEMQRGGWQAILDNFAKFTEAN
jgi:uncharacterized protein YndB with AHSA1/START domain